MLAHPAVSSVIYCLLSSDSTGRALLVIAYSQYANHSAVTYAYADTLEQQQHVAEYWPSSAVRTMQQGNHHHLI